MTAKISNLQEIGCVDSKSDVWFPIEIKIRGVLWLCIRWQTGRKLQMIYRVVPFSITFSDTRFQEHTMIWRWICEKQYKINTWLPQITDRKWCGLYVLSNNLLLNADKSQSIVLGTACVQRPRYYVEVADVALPVATTQVARRHSRSASDMQRTRNCYGNYRVTIMLERLGV